MAVEVIPAGASAVVTESGGYRKGCSVDFGDFEIMQALKDAEANLHKDAGDKFINTIQDVKDAETRLHKDAGDKFINTIQDVKDAESRLLKDAGDKFINLVQDTKDAETRVTDAVRTS